MQERAADYYIKNVYHTHGQSQGQSIKTNKGFTLNELQPAQCHSTM